jgi:hypothetical protein
MRSSRELTQKTNVVLNERSQVTDLMTHQGATIDAKAKGESTPLVTVDAHGLQNGGVQHPASAEFEPSGGRTRAASDSTADGARDFELRRGFGERKVARAQT